MVFVFMYSRGLVNQNSGLVQRCQPLDTKNQIEYPKKSDFQEKNQIFTKSQRLSHLLQGRIVALLLILQNSCPRWRIVQRFCTHCGVYFYMVLRHYPASIEFWGVFCFVLFWFVVFWWKVVFSRGHIVLSYFCLFIVLNMITSYWLASLQNPSQEP